jgi:Mrp family chromosome partitioning ATPase
LILAVVAVATGGTYLYYASKPKLYTASTQVLIQASASDVGFSAGNATRTANNILQLLKSSPVVEEVVRSVGGSGRVTAAASSDSDFVTVTVTADTPQRAARLANAYVDALISGRESQLRKNTEEGLRAARQDLEALPPGPQSAGQRTQLKSQIADLQAALTLPRAGAEPVGRAQPPSGPSEPRPLRNAAFAFVLSLLLAVAAVYVLDRLDKRIRHVEDVERAYGVSLFGVVPHHQGQDPMVDQSFDEAFRSLLTNIQCADLDRPPRTVLVTSALPGEGKSTVVRNLALAARDSGLRVAVVESDLRNPSLATMFRIEATPGLVNVLSGGMDLGDALQRVAADAPVAVAAPGAATNGDSSPVPPGSISVLTSGTASANPPAVLATEGLSSLFDQITAEYDLALIDSSPLLTVSDAVPLLARADATILVARVGQVTVPAVRRVTEILRRHPRMNVLGVVANDVSSKEFKRLAAGYFGTAA